MKIKMNMLICYTERIASFRPFQCGIGGLAHRILVAFLVNEQSQIPGFQLQVVAVLVEDSY